MAGPARHRCPRADVRRPIRQVRRRRTGRVEEAFDRGEWVRQRREEHLTLCAQVVVDVGDVHRGGAVGEVHDAGALEREDDTERDGRVQRARSDPAEDGRQLIVVRHDDDDECEADRPGDEHADGARRNPRNRQ